MEKDYGYFTDLQGAIVMKRISSKKGMPRKRHPRPGDPHLLGVLSGVPAPNPAEQRDR